MDDVKALSKEEREKRIAACRNNIILDWVMGWEATCQALEAERDRLRAGADGALHELGVPTPDYPAPVARAVEWLQDALQPCKHDGLILDTNPPKCGKCGVRGSRSSNKVFTPDT